jgi:hypothetical protein
MVVFDNNDGHHSLSIYPQGNRAMNCFPNWVYKPKHIHDNNLVMDSWSVNDYQVKADTYAEDAALRVSGRKLVLPSICNCSTVLNCSS